MLGLRAKSSATYRHSSDDPPNTTINACIDIVFVLFWIMCVALGALDYVQCIQNRRMFRQPTPN